MTLWTDRQIASALYSQLFLVGLSLRDYVASNEKLVEALLANAHGPVNRCRHPSGPVRDEEREIRKLSAKTNNANETFDAWLARQKEADNEIDTKGEEFETGIDEGAERAGSTAHESE